MLTKSGEPAKVKKFELTIEIDGKKKYIGTRDPAQAIIDFKPEVIKGKVILSLEWQGKRVEKLLFVNRARRVFYNPLTAKIFARDLIRAIT